MSKAEDKGKKKEEKGKAEAGKDAKEAEAPKEETPEGAGKKRKLVLWGGLGVIVSTALAVGGFFVKKTLSGGGSEKSMAAHATDGKADDGHGDAKKDEHGEPAKDEHGDKKDDGHGDAKKDDGHGDAKKDDGHGDAKKDDGHGDAKKDDGHGEPAKDDGHGEKKDGGAAKDKAKAEGTSGKPSEFGQSFDIQRMDLNLGNPLENRFLRVSISLRHFGGDAQQEELKIKLPQIKDIVISLFGAKTRGELLSKEGKAAVRNQLKRELNEVLEKPIHSVYFTEFFVE